MAQKRMRVAVVGGGWSGLAAAVAAVQAGHDVTLLEAARTLGGRARTVSLPGPDGVPMLLDNGQHILIGAYTECLRLMKTVGVDPQTALLRLPLTMRFADGSGLQWPDIAPPWDAALGILRASGWSWRERLALLARAQRWQRQRFVCAPELSVAQLCSGLPPRLWHEFVEPLCVAALNTPGEEASGQVFLRILRDSLFSGPGGSNLLLPRVDLGALLPDAAARWLRLRGAVVRTGERVASLTSHAGGWAIDGAPFDAVLLACPSTEAARLVAQCAQAAPLTDAVALCDWAASAETLRFESITTSYLQAEAAHSGSPGSAPSTLARPMLALRTGPAQFVFDRGQLGGPPGLLAFVASASRTDRTQTEAAIVQQAAHELGLKQVKCVQTVVERRATFACTPGVARPASHVAPNLWACGDYVQGPYPATLEGAVQNGNAAAHALGTRE